MYKKMRQDFILDKYSKHLDTFHMFFSGIVKLSIAAQISGCLKATSLTCTCLVLLLFVVSNLNWNSWPRWPQLSGRYLLKEVPIGLFCLTKKNQLLKVMSSGEKNPFLTSLFKSCGTPDDGLFVDSCDWSFLSFLSVVTSSVSSTALL